jgi:Tol biopolymer transport system component
MKRFHQGTLLILVSMELGLCGCNSGGAAGGGISALTEQTTAFGDMTVRAANLNPPIWVNGTSASTIGLTGQITGAEVRTLSNDIQSTAITFTRKNNGDTIFVANADGSNETPIATGTHPSWSPDGSKIVFETKVNSRSQIATMNADGSNQTVLTSVSSNETPAWSPDGTKIAFTSARDGGLDGNLEIYVMNANGTNQTRITTNVAVDQQPAWSPDGTRIAFTSNRDGDQEIYVMNADGTRQRRLTDRVGADVQPAWAPADNIAFARGGGNLAQPSIGIMTPGGILLSGFHKTNVNLSNPAWSPDGKKIVCSGEIGDFRILYLGSSDGTSVEQLVPINFGFFQGHSTEPHWSSFRMRLPLIGADGRCGSAATGFIYATGNRRPASAVAWNNTDFTTLKLTALGGLSPSGDVIAYNLEGSTSAVKIGSLTYWNFTSPKAYIINSTVVINGAIISIDAWTGYVTSVLPFTAPNRSAGKPTMRREGAHILAQGNFVGVWNAAGKNVAPRGASRVRLDAKTGAISQVE